VIDRIVDQRATVSSEGERTGKKKESYTEDTEDAESAEKTKQGELKLAATEAGRT